MRLDPITATRYFKRVHATVCQYREEMVAAKAAPLNDEGRGGGPVKVGNYKAEYVADFANCGKRALFCWPQRLEIFNRCFVEGEGMREVMKDLDVAETTFFRWIGQMRRTVGCEVDRQGLVRRKHKDLIIEEDLEAMGKR